MILTNARLIFSDGIRDGLEVVVDEGKIAAIREAKSPGDDLRGHYLAPGFIDMHVHGALGRDTMEATPDAFTAICDFHASGGTTSLLLTTVTAPMDEISLALSALSEFGREDSRVLGAHVEGPFISKARRGAQREEFICDPAPELVERLLMHSDVIKMVTLAPELPDALEFIDRLRGQQIRVSGGHSDAWGEEARAAFEHGMRQVTHTFNCMSSTRRRGIYREPGLLEFALSEPEILCELIADGNHVAPTLMKMLFHAKGPAGICLVTDATAGAGLANGERFSLGGLECLIENGACLLGDRSALAGSAARMIDLIRTVVREVGAPLHEAIGMATENPARALGNYATKGRLVPGTDADLVVLSSELEVEQTFSAGREIYVKAPRESGRSRARRQAG